MGTRVFFASGSDIVGLTGNYVAPTPTGDIVPVLSDGGVKNITISGNKTENNAGGGTVDSQVTYLHSFNFDFQNFPAVPLTATILKTRLKIVETGSLDLTTVGALAATNVVAFPVTIPGLTNPSSGPYNFSSGVITENLDVTQHHNPGISYATFNAVFGPVAIELGPLNVGAGYPAGGSALVIYSIARTEYFVEVWWQETYYSLTPTTNITPGLTPVTITSGIDDLLPLTNVKLKYMSGGTEITETVPSSAFTSHTAGSLTFVVPSNLSLLTLAVSSDETLFNPGQEEIFGFITTVSGLGLGSISFGGASSMSFIGNPSGIYTLVKGKTHDTLYERGATDSVDVKIPDPTIRTGYVG